jgi:DNA-binding NtrC family response regulator
MQQMQLENTPADGEHCIGAALLAAAAPPPSEPPPPPAVVEAVRFGRLAARSTSMKRAFAILRRLAPTDMTITLIGETGTGKDVLAQIVHEASPRARGNFAVLDCGAVAPNLAESELMGHERGSFTGAIAQYVGAFERANGGTLFIDEVGELPLDLQTRLLRVLESRKIRRVGGGQDRAVDVRVIAATNRELEADVSAGRFRRDLYFRLAAAVVRVPPLRERYDDLNILIPQLVADLGCANVRVAPSVFEWAATRSWPGNVRELKNALAYGLAFVDHGVLEADALSSLFQSSETAWLARLPLTGFTLAQIEQAAIQQTLVQTQGNKMKAARVLGIAVSTLYEKLKRYQIT